VVVGVGVGVVVGVVIGVGVGSFAVPLPVGGVEKPVALLVRVLVAVAGDEVAATGRGVGPRWPPTSTPATIAAATTAPAPRLHQRRPRHPARFGSLSLSTPSPSTRRS